MNFDEWKAEFIIMLDYHSETLSIDIDLWYRKYLGKGIEKYKQFTDSQLILIRNNLHSKINKISKRLGYNRTK